MQLTSTLLSARGRLACLLACIIRAHVYVIEAVWRASEEPERKRQRVSTVSSNGGGGGGAQEFLRKHPGNDHIYAQATSMGIASIKGIFPASYGMSIAMANS